MAECGYALASHVRCLARDYERFPEVLAGLRSVALAFLMLQYMIPVMLVHNRL